MSSTPYGEPLEALVRPSRLVAVLLCLMHMLAALVCAPLPIPFDYRVALLLAIVSAFFWNMYSFMQRTPKRVNWSKEAGWSMTDRHGVEHQLLPQPEVYLGTWLVVAYFKDEAGKKHHHAGPRQYPRRCLPAHQGPAALRDPESLSYCQFTCSVPPA